MAVVKRFFFDGDEIREERTKKTDKTEKMGKNGNKITDKKVMDRTSMDKKGQKTGLDMGEIRMLVSSILKKNGKYYARVSFLRGEDIAEGIVPDGTLETVSGFSEEEAAGLKFYLAANKEEILAQAKQIDPLTNWLRTPPRG